MSDIPISENVDHPTIDDQKAAEYSAAERTDYRETYRQRKFAIYNNIHAMFDKACHMMCSWASGLSADEFAEFEAEFTNERRQSLLDELQKSLYNPTNNNNKPGAKNDTTS